MASITFNFTAAQSNRIDQARIIYNQQNDTNLTPKQWILLIIKENVMSLTLPADYQAPVALAQVALNADLAGNA